jgi:hypothetical protein
MGALLPTGLRAASVQQQPIRAWTDSTGSYRIEAAFVRLENHQVSLVTADGQTVAIPFDRLSQVDQGYVRRLEAGGRAAGGSRTKELRVTGVGPDFVKARQNAFVRAVTQTINVLVDAETVVENERILRDKIVAFSPSYVPESEVLREWREEGQSKAYLRIIVDVSKLEAHLKASNVTLRAADAEGEVFLWQHDAVTPGGAARIFEKTMGDFRMDKFLAPKIPGDVETLRREALIGEVRVRVDLCPDLRKWSRYASATCTFLSKVTAQRCKYTWELVEDRHGQPRWRITAPPERQLHERLAGPGIVLSVFVGISDDGRRTEWEAFRVPEAFEPIVVKAAQRSYRLVSAPGRRSARRLADGTGNGAGIHGGSPRDLRDAHAGGGGSLFGGVVRPAGIPRLLDRPASESAGLGATGEGSRRESRPAPAGAKRDGVSRRSQIDRRIDQWGVSVARRPTWPAGKRRKAGGAWVGRCKVSRETLAAQFRITCAAWVSFLAPPCGDARQPSPALI